MLMIVVDDLRTSLGCYGDPHAITPNIDALAERGALFERAYVQQAVCAASRASVLTGCRPETTGVDYPYPPEFADKFVTEHPTIPTWFDDHGYVATIGGKIHHQQQQEIEQLDGGHLAGKPGHWRDYVLPENLAIEEGEERAAPYEAAEGPDDIYRDGVIAQQAIERMKAYAAGDRAEALFLGVGFAKPHLPFNAPKKYWDLYDPDELGDSRSDAPAGSQPWMQATYELPQYGGGFGTGEQDNPITNDVAKTLRHGYYACVSYVDALVGKLVSALQETGLADDTVVCLWSDHGFHLGDNGMWGKHVNYEVATRAPLLFAGAGVPGGVRCGQLVEFVDIYPTLCDLAGVATPGGLEGQSLRPLMDDPTLPGDAAAFSQYPRGNREGYSIRTDRWRYVEWRERDGGAVVARELYDHASDPGETTNVVDEQSVENLANALSDHFGFA